MIIQQLLSHNELVAFSVDEIKENNACVKIDVDYYIKNELDKDKVINLAIDKYYESLRLGETPCSIDNLVLIKRGDNRFSVYLIELKDVSKLKRLKIDKIKSKFDTTLNDFMLNRYKDEFDSQNLKIVDFNLWLVCNRFSFLNSEITQEQYKKHIENSFIEMLMLVKPFKYKNKIAKINPMYPKAEIN